MGTVPRGVTPREARDGRTGGPEHSQIEAEPVAESESQAFLSHKGQRIGLRSPARGQERFYVKKNISSWIQLDFKSASISLC